MRIGIKVLLKNDHFVQAMKDKGFNTFRELSKASGLPAQTLQNYCGLKAVPKSERVISILELTLDKKISELFPDDLVKSILNKPRTSFYIKKEIAELSYTDKLQLSYNP